MPNTQLKSLNQAVLENLKSDQHYIALEPIRIKREDISSIEVGDIVLVAKEPKFVIRTQKNIIAKVLLAKKGYEEGVLVSSIPKKFKPLKKGDSKFAILDIRLAVIPFFEIELDRWVGFGWSISSNLSIFVDDKIICSGRLVETAKGVGVEILKMRGRSFE